MNDVSNIDKIHMIWFKPKKPKKSSDYINETIETHPLLLLKYNFF